jgi:hypothetical protein
MELQSTLTALELRILQYAAGIAGPFQPGHVGAILPDESMLSIQETTEALVRKNLLTRPGHDSRGPVNYVIMPAGTAYLRSLNGRVERVGFF